MARTGTAATRRTARHALDRRFTELRPLTTRAATPRGGWIRAIRDALGMPAADLARLMGTGETSVLRLEANETAGSIKLDTLRRAAAALDCDLVYAVVPRGSLEDRLDARATQVARALLSAVDHSMTLEEQQVGTEASREQLRETASRLRDSPGLWRDA